MDENRGGQKSPIDRLRESAGSFDLNVPGDDSDVHDLISTGDRLLAVKGKAVYEIRMADEVDPQRTNARIPNTVQKILSFGAESHWVGATLLTARQLLDRTYLPSRIDVEAAFGLIIRIAQDISANYELAQTYLDQEQRIIDTLNPKIRPDRSFVVPAVGSVESRCKEFIQKLDHAVAGLFDVVQLFYIDVGRGGWEAFKEKIDREDAGVDNFPEFLAGSVPLLVQVRNARNCVEHPRPEQRIAVSDFYLDADGRLGLPSIEVVHPKSALARTPIRKFLVSTMREVVHAVELMVVFLCARHVESVGAFPVQVVEVPEDKRRLNSVRYGYGLITRGGVVPMS